MTTNGIDFRSIVRELTGLREEYSRDAPIMSEYERLRFGRAREAREDVLRPLALASLRVVVNNTIQEFADASANVEKLKAEGTARWDSGKLNSAVVAFERDAANAGRDFGRVKALYETALASADPYQARAAVVVAQGIGRQFPSGTNDYGRAHQLQMDANRRRELMDTPDGLAEAEVLGAKVADKVIALKSEALSALEVLGGSRDIAGQLARISLSYESGDNFKNFLVTHVDIADAPPPDGAYMPEKGAPMTARKTAEMM